MEKIEPIEVKATTEQTTSEKLVSFVKQVRKDYKSPTPLPWRNIGDAIMGLGTVVSTISAFTASPWVTVVSVALTWLGKTLTNFATK